MKKPGFPLMFLPKKLLSASRKRLGAYALIVLALTGIGITAAGSKSMAPLALVPPGQGISFPREFFGMHIHNSEKPGHWPTVPFGSWRLWDAGVSWANLEPFPGRWRFDQLDAGIGRAQAANVSILLALGRTPKWASARPQEHAPYGPGQAAEPANIDDWRIYVRTVATRYKGRISAYEIWNEANERMFWTGSIPKLVELTRVAREEIKRIDPSAVIVSPSATGMEPGFKWLRSYLDAGGGALVDVISFHLYDSGKPPEAMVAKIMALRDLLKQGGYAAKPLWDTETGLLVDNRIPAPDVTWSADWKKQRLVPDQAVDYMVRAFLLARALGFERYYWYAWDNRWLGLIEPGDLSPKAPAEAYGRAYAYLLRSTLQRCDRNEIGLWKCNLSMANGAPAQALWMDPAAAQQLVTIPSPFVGHIIRFDGQARQVSPANSKITVGPSVALFVQSNQ